MDSNGLHIDRVFVYGSQARGESSSQSDIDVMLVADIFDTDDDRILSKPWLFAADIDYRIEPVAVGTKRFNNDSTSPLISVVKEQGIEL
jgi:predicted nucleotidyltransferase